MNPASSVEQELAAHASALRAMARDLVGRDHADDLVQQTALRALSSPPGRATGLGGWLATILRRLASNHRRSQRRRTAHESAVAHADFVPAVDEDVARREILRRTTMAVFSLPEPYQATLLERYYEGRTPLAISRRTGVPLATVKSRLQRGLLILRATLDERPGTDARDWRRALLVATGWGVPSAAAATLAVWTLLMMNSGKISLAAGVLASALVWWTLTNEGTTAPPQNVAPSVGESAAEAARGPIIESSPASRSEVTPPDQAGRDFSHPFSLQLRCRLIDEFGLPVAGRKVSFGPLGCARNIWDVASDENGVIDIAWPSRVPSQQIAVGVHRHFQAEKLRSVAVDAQRTAEITLLAQPRGGTTGVMLGTAIRLNATGSGGRTFTITSDSFGFFGGNSPSRAHPGMHPDAILGDQLLNMPTPQGPELAIGGLSFSTFDIRSIGDLEVVEDEPAPPTGRVVGTVFGSDGKPAADVMVCWGRAVDRPAERARTDAQGRYEFTGITEGPIELRAGGGPEGLGRARSFANPDGVATANLHLDPGSTIRGAATGKAGAPLAGYRVIYESLDGQLIDLAVTDDRGHYRLANVPGPGRLLLRTNDDAALPIAVIDCALPDSAADFRVDDETGAAGRLLFRAATDKPREDLVGRVWQPETGRGAELPQPDADGLLQLGGLPAGYYQVELGTPTGWMDLGRHYVDGKGELELGALPLPAGGTMELSGPQGSRSIELYHRRPYGDIRADAGLGDRVRVELATGDWLLFFRDGEGPVHSRAFTITPGAVRRIELPEPPR